MFSHPRLLKCRQARISPKFLKPEMRKHRQGSNFLKIPKILASMGSARAIVAQILGILGKFDPCRCFRISGFKTFGKFDPCRCFRILGCPPPMIHCLEKAASCGAWGGRGEHIYIYIYIDTYMCIHILVTGIWTFSAELHQGIQSRYSSNAMLLFSFVHVLSYKKILYTYVRAFLSPFGPPTCTTCIVSPCVYIGPSSPLPPHKHARFPLFCYMYKINRYRIKSTRA